MASATQNLTTLTPEEMEMRRLAVEGAIGSLRIEGMEPGSRELEIVNQFAHGDIDLSTMNAQLDACLEADLPA